MTRFALCLSVGAALLACTLAGCQTSSISQPISNQMASSVVTMEPARNSYTPTKILIPSILPALNTTEGETLTPTSIPFLTNIPSPSPTQEPTETSTPSETATSTPLPTKEVLLQFGVFGGDGGNVTDSYFGRSTPRLILFTDGQLLIRKSDYKGTWFAETTLTTPQICSLLSRIDSTGFFEVKGNGMLGIDDPIYKFDSTTQFSEGGPYYVIQVNGNKHKLVEIYYDYVPYLIPEVKRAFNLFNNYSPPSILTNYQAQFMLLWIEQGPGDSIYSTPAPIPQNWPTNLPSLDILEKDKVETRVNLEDDYAGLVSQVLVQGEYVKPISELFGNRLASKLFKTGNNQYYVISRPLLPNETLKDFSSSPYQDKEFDLPFKCPK